jgi:hypothetical protein
MKLKGPTVDDLVAAVSVVSREQYDGNPDELNRIANSLKCSGGNAADQRTC